MFTYCDHWIVREATIWILFVLVGFLNYLAGQESVERSRRATHDDNHANEGDC